MSNLVTPMLTSVENSPTVDFYPTSLHFTNSPFAILKNSNDQLCISDSTGWNDLDHLVGRSPLFKTSTPNKSQTLSCNRRVFSNSSVSNENTLVSDNKSSVKDHGQPGEHDLIPFQNSLLESKVINNLWNVPNSENNSCSKACVNVNMGYNEGSSLESMVSHKNPKIKPELNLHFNRPDCTNIKQGDSVATNDQSANIVFKQLSQLNDEEQKQVKVFKNGSKTGHSRQWGSCGSAVTLDLPKDKIQKHRIQDIKAFKATTVFPDTTVSPELRTIEIRNKSFSQSNGLKRISQLSFEAEFDSDGRTHEQIIIDFRKYDPFTMSGQITHIELAYFKAIKSEEFLSMKWNTLTKHTHAPGIVASTRWFNQLNFWAQRIILECSELNRRVETLAYVIRIIKKLVDCFNNLSSGMALMSALEVECIHRLKQTWNTLPGKDKATFRRMQELFSTTSNYEKLREHINSLKLPCIPYLGLYLTDLTYINLAHSKLSEFESQTKTDQINNILRTVSEFQQSEYDVGQSPLLYRYLESQRYIEELQKIIEENNYRTSMFLEPNLEIDHPVGATVSPQKTPPSYACKHVSSKPPGTHFLQSPISPKPMSARPHDESIHEVPEMAADGTLMQPDSGVTSEGSPGHAQVPLDEPDNAAGPVYEESLMMSSRYSDEDSVRASLLCGTNRKSYFTKRSASKSIRFKRDSSASSRQQVSSKTGTLSSNSQSVVSDKEILGQQHSKSLLDDSYLDATMTETCSGAAAVDVDGLAVAIGDVSIVSSKQGELLCSPPICRCRIKGDVVDLKPKASTKRKTEYSNLVNIAHAAETAAQFSKKDSYYHNQDLEGSGIEESPNTDDKEVLKLVCQGVLSRKACLKNSKRSRFSMWNRHWIVLVMSKNNAFLVMFENSQFRALERKDFKSKKCHVQDLKGVTISRCPPLLDRNIAEQNIDLSQTSEDSNDIGRSFKKFFLIDKEYGTVYKFRDPSSKSRSGSPRGAAKKAAAVDAEHEHCLRSSPSSDQMPSLSLWYRCLKRCIRRINRPLDDNKDLIVLGDA